MGDTKQHKMEADPKEFLVKKLHPEAIIPQRATPGAAGLDVYAMIDLKIPVGEIGKIPTGISIELPEKCYARLAGRSSLEIGKGVSLKGGVIDRDYRGEVLVA